MPDIVLRSLQVLTSHLILVISHEKSTLTNSILKMWKLRL